jgi:hypothetical protein
MTSASLLRLLAEEELAILPEPSESVFVLSGANGGFGPFPWGLAAVTTDAKIAKTRERFRKFMTTDPE